MDIEKSNSHGNDHRDHSDAHYKTGYQEERAAELTENADHEGHVAAESQYARICLRQLVEIHHLVQSVNKKQDAEENPEKKYQKGNSLPSEILGKKKIIKHNSPF